MNGKTIRTIIFGIGKHWDTVKWYMSDELEIIAYMDNNVQTTGGGQEERSFLPEKWKELNFDKILICVVNYQDKLTMMNQLLDLGVENNRIGFVEEYQNNYQVCINVIEKDVVEVCTDDLIVRCENDIEFMIAEEIFAAEEYGFHANGNVFVIDVGMNIGCASLYFASKDYVTNVYGFEPGKEVYEKAISNIRMNKNSISEKITTYNIGLGKQNCKEKYIAHQGKLTSAGIKKVQDGANVGYTESVVEIEIKQASSILEKIFSCQVEKCILKMDCEGAEYGILEDLIISGLIERIDIIIMEWHVGKYKQLEKMLHQAGFQYLLNKEHRDFGKCYAWK